MHNFFREAIENASYSWFVRFFHKFRWRQLQLNANCANFCQYPMHYTHICYWNNVWYAFALRRFDIVSMDGKVSLWYCENLCIRVASMSGRIELSEWDHPGISGCQSWPENVHEDVLNYAVYYAFTYYCSNANCPLIFHCAVNMRRLNYITEACYFHWLSWSSSSLRLSKAKRLKSRTKL